MITQVEKRDGRIVEFNANKIKNAIKKAFLNTDGQSFDDNLLENLTFSVVLELEKNSSHLYKVEEIQDIVERVLMEKGFYDVSKKYIVYRQNRSIARQKRHKVYKAIADIVRITGRENANVGTGPSAKLLQISEAEGREFMEKELTSEEVLEAMRENILYPHDYSWGAIGTTTCCFIPLKKLLLSGFDAGHGWIRSPKRIKTAAQLSCILMQSNQNDQHGGQAYGWYDRDMVPFVKREFDWQKRDIKQTLQTLGADSREEEIDQLAWEKTRAETMQAMEALVFNANTMHSRAGAQVPFFSINFGTDTSKEGRLISEALLIAYEKGLGKGEQPLFPNLIFKIRDGVNMKEGDPNFDLLQLSMRVSSKRLFPNYIFQDSSFNRDFPMDVPTMGCRTRVAWNINKPNEEQTVNGRGNLSFTTNNLVGIALKAKYKEDYTQSVEEQYQKLLRDFDIQIPKTLETNDVKKFFVLLNQYTDLAIKQLFERFKYQCSFTKQDFPFLMNGIWLDTEKLKAGETLEEYLKHGTLSLGFIGLAETLKCLIGKHHGEDAEADKLGEAIISFLRAKLDKATEKSQLNYSLLATPAEGLSGKFTKKDRKEYGIIEGVTDKDWYTNSFHVPVEYPISLFEKIKIEGKYHKYCNAGHISYVELASPPKDNLEAYYNILMYMAKNDMGYVALNFPVDRCRQCNTQGVIDGDCHVCGSSDISRIRRITGYLAELNLFNDAKKQEVANRVKHL